MGTNSRIDDNAGRLEVCRNGLWGTISSTTFSSTTFLSTTFWSQKNTQVACRQLGFEGGLNSIPANQYVYSVGMCRWVCVCVCGCGFVGV